MNSYTSSPFVFNNFISAVFVNKNTLSNACIMDFWFKFTPVAAVHIDQKKIDQENASHRPTFL